MFPVQIGPVIITGDISFGVLFHLLTLVIVMLVFLVKTKNYQIY